MLAVAQVNYIRHEVNQKGETYASVGRRMGVDPRTVTNTLIRKSLRRRKNKSVNHL